ncbi:hypothetical protein D3C72_2467830 [compost metagenome]
MRESVVRLQWKSDDHFVNQSLFNDLFEVVDGPEDRLVFESELLVNIVALVVQEA